MEVGRCYMDIMAIILAAGEGTRMKSKTHKILHTLCGRAMIDYSVDAFKELGVDQPIVVIGHAADSVREHLGTQVQFAVQDKATGWGTGHAVMSAIPLLQGKKGLVYVLGGDMPLVRADALQQMGEAVQNGVACAMLTAIADDPAGYGRILRDEKGDVSAIVEQRDCTPEQKQVREICSLGFCFDIEKLLTVLPRLSRNNNQNEYYLTEAVEILRADNERVVPIVIPMEDSLGVNDRVQLADCTKVLQHRINQRLMYSGVTLIDPASSYIDDTATVGADTVIYPNCVLQGNTRIGSDCVIYSNCRMSNAVVGDGSTVESSVLTDCQVGNHTTVGPNAYLRPKTVVGDHCRIGDFVEVKNSNIGNGTKVSHLTYVGDADLGERINLGCGVVFSNYDGKSKYRSTIGDDAFIGCNVNLISPVNVAADSYIAAGSTITQDVPAQALAIARSKQTNLTGWVKKRREDGKL